MPFDPEDNIFLLPGPVKLHPRILRAAQATAMNHRSAEFRRVIRGLDSGLKVLFSTKRAEVCTLTASASAGMEAAASNLLRQGDRAIVLHNGKFGERFLELAKRYAGASNVVSLGAPYGQPVDLEALRVALEAKPARAVFAVLNESSTGVKNPGEKIGELCRKHDAFFVADGVTAFGGMEAPMDKWGIDIAVCGSQKAIAAPPGLAFVAVSPEVRPELKSPGLYLDLPKHLDEAKNESTPFTPATHLFLAAEEALIMLEEEGIEARIARSARVARALRAAIKLLGLSLLPAEGYASDTVTAIRYPPGVGDAEVREVLKNEWGIVVAGGQGELKGKILRVAHMGYVAPREVAAFLVAFESSLARVAKTIPTGLAAGAFAAALGT